MSRDDVFQPEPHELTEARMRVVFLEKLLEKNRQAWRALEWLNKHATDLEQGRDCIPCMRASGAFLMRGNPEQAFALACEHVRNSRKTIDEARDEMKAQGWSW